jgi:cytidyltransferase-like protein
MKIGLVPMAAKPYHAGHHSLVESAAAQNDRVIVYVSTSDRKRKGEFPIMGQDMIRVWQEELEGIMPGNVEIQYGGSPVRKVYEELERADSSNSADVFVIYSDPADTARNYPEKNRQKSFPGIYNAGQVLFAAEEDPAAYTRGEGTPDISGTKMRASLEACKFEDFAKNLPDGVNTENVYKILCGKDPHEGKPDPANESLLRAFIRNVL